MQVSFECRDPAGRRPREFAASRVLLTPRRREGSGT